MQTALAADMGAAGYIFTGAHDECLEGTIRLLRSDIAGKRARVRHIPGPTGVRGRNSDNRLIRQKLGWAPSQPLKTGLETTYRWIEQRAFRNAA